MVGSPSVQKFPIDNHNPKNPRPDGFLEKDTFLFRAEKITTFDIQKVNWEELKRTSGDSRVGPFNFMQSASGVRGQVGTGQLSQEHQIYLMLYAYRYGEFLAQKYKGMQESGTAPENILVLLGQDTRKTGAQFRAIMKLGILRALEDQKLADKLIFKDCGVVTTPVIEAGMRRYPKALGGVMITASHNPEDSNGFKFLASGGDPNYGSVLPAKEAQLIIDAVNNDLGKIDTEHFEDLKQLVQSFSTIQKDDNWKRTKKSGLKDKRQKHGRKFLRKYKKEILTVLGCDKFDFISESPQYIKTEIVVDSNGSASIGYVKKALKYVVGHIVDTTRNKRGETDRPIEPEGEGLNNAKSFFGKPEYPNLCLVMVPDHDVDRANTVVDGKEVEPQQMAALSVVAMLSRVLSYPQKFSRENNQKIAIVVHTGASQRIADICKQISDNMDPKVEIEVFESKVGEAHVIAKMRELEAQGYYVPMGVEAAGGGSILKGTQVRDGTLNTLLLYLAMTDSEMKKTFKKMFKQQKFDDDKFECANNLLQITNYYTVQGKMKVEVGTKDNATINKEIETKLRALHGDRNVIVDKTDGLKIKVYALYEPDKIELTYWVRSSNTEPGVLRVMSDSYDQQIADKGDVDLRAVVQALIDKK